ncbi:Myosin tail [Musa troglodytarum]|uniref:Myosin tail n=1 Tax=Musa troglodytarum TaxID=320322 RepID=A0A9E7JCU2_9LILI|nr:Myosin tail [Musa troglodytarum]
MDRFKNMRKLQVEVEEENGDGGYNGEKALEAQNEEAEAKEVAEELGQFTALKVRRRAALFGECKGDYVGVPSDPFLHRILTKQDFAIYLVDPDADVLKRRIALAAVEKICLSKFDDNFFALIVPTEYDCLMASTRKTEIANVLMEATKGASEEIEVVFSNRGH